MKEKGQKTTTGKEEEEADRNGSVNDQQMPAFGEKKQKQLTEDGPRTVVNMQ